MQGGWLIDKSILEYDGLLASNAIHHVAILHTKEQVELEGG